MSDFRETYTAIPCNCGHPICKAWHVYPIAAVQCVRFTKEQAEAVAKLLNEMEDHETSETVEVSRNEYINLKMIECEWLKGPRG